ncbi:unnamed protein product [Brassica napus]|uniref:(rape) hypothetical protein n=1 Tax=Brassica napus TaxID=3708 RepID=A0A816NK36_BRANA|nr:unnamed protein product [Brassica napus]
MAENFTSMLEFSGVFPLFKEPIAFEEGVYVYEMEQKIDDVQIIPADRHLWYSNPGETRR